MVVPKIGAQWAIKKIADEVMAPPTPPPDPSEPAAAPQQTHQAPVEEYDEFDGELFEVDGDVVGTAHRMRAIGVYLVSDSHGNLEKELQDCIEDEESRRYFIRDKRGRLTGVVFAPHPDRMPSRAEALRADEI
ncbi:MAG: hypothetical protein KC438_04860 [Thermomicrobiales bacterium]|nr:hypothetical protein [Thermomicrobiales bacterium]MCO5223228.1 hypothetical protein [Thermomicrobiales bacterium]